MKAAKGVEFWPWGRVYQRLVEGPENNVWHYYQATDDLQFLREHGAEMMLEIARFWASIAHYNPERPHLALELRPSALDDLGLPKAIENFLDEWSERSRIEVDPGL